ncbi:uncharacterized protein LOC131878266 [Tigriopus californicus]|uniref:uncharacterized protein LOC131878266 n=1 Tax=Tigriopus californicus TaxID=6832 RepID=UPI0027DA1A68|nr:uncharacterized protein LOC131878266 [Tigriopus californicus]
MSETVTDIVSKDRLTKAHPWEMSRLRTPFTWTIAKATKQTPAWSSPTIPSAGPAPQFNMTPLVTSAAPKSNLDPAPNPVNDPEQQPIHPPMDDASLVDDDSILIPHVNTEPEPRIAPKQKASILNDSLSPTKPGHKKMVLANDFAGTMAEATFHVSSFLVGGPSFFTEHPHTKDRRDPIPHGFAERPVSRKTLHTDLKRRSGNICAWKPSPPQ